MARRILCTDQAWALAALALTLALPLAADPLPKVGAIFVIESPVVFPNQLLGESKEAIEKELSAHLAERLKFYFPFFDWTPGETPSDNSLRVMMVDQQTALCDWQTLFAVRTVRAGSEPTEMVGVHDVPLYDLCNPFVIPNRRDPDHNALLPEDAEALVGKLKKYIENGTGEFGGLLNNKTNRKAIHNELLSTVPLAKRVELREQDNGSKLLYLPINFSELKASIADPDCEREPKNCSLLKLTLNLPGSPPANLSLRIAGSCNDLVLCEVLSGGVPGGFQVASRTWWEDDLGDLLAQAESLSFTMSQFAKSPHACATLPETSLFVEP